MCKSGCASQDVPSSGAPGPAVDQSQDSVEAIVTLTGGGGGSDYVCPAPPYIPRPAA